MTDFFQDGFTHIFVMEFENEEDRKYYIEKEPAHLAAKKIVERLWKMVQAVDFTSGVF